MKREKGHEKLFAHRIDNLLFHSKAEKSEEDQQMRVDFSVFHFHFLNQMNTAIRTIGSWHTDVHRLNTRKIMQLR